MSRKLPGTCSISGCGRSPVNRTLMLCQTHYRRHTQGKDIYAPIQIKDAGRGCLVAGCDRKHSALGFCEAHYKRHSQGMDVDGAPIRTYAPGQWSEWYVHKSGYVFQYRQHEGKKQSRQQHRVVMEEKLGRKLLPEETVHHINGIRHDNRLENLELWSSSHPPGQRVVDKLAWAKQMIELYEGSEGENVWS